MLFVATKKATFPLIVAVKLFVILHHITNIFLEETTILYCNSSIKNGQNDFFFFLIISSWFGMLNYIEIGIKILSHNMKKNLIKTIFFNCVFVRWNSRMLFSTLLYHIIFHNGYTIQQCNSVIQFCYLFEYNE